MNAAQIHLALNHAPLFLSIFGGILLLLGMIRKNQSFKNLSLYLMIAAAIFTAPVFLTGEGTEELVEHLQGVNENAIERHEDMAKISLLVIIVTGVVALTGLFFRKKAGLTKLILGIALVLSLASFGTMAQTAHLGGLIRHSELQNGSPVNEQDENESEEDD
ncbi:MAG: hypothetical protein HOP10_07475 [Chitinophagaceae bacterium]|nr:hypothetical protein [Chitinophagaceae bacterium]